MDNTNPSKDETQFKPLGPIERLNEIQYLLRRVRELNKIMANLMREEVQVEGMASLIDAQNLYFVQADDLIDGGFTQLYAIEKSGIAA